MKKYLGFIPALVLTFAFNACNNSDDDLPVSGLEPTEDLDAQDFIWKAMNLWYFWQGEVADLADNRFSSNEEYSSFLQATPDARDFFDNLNFVDDRFSVLYDDYRDMVNFTAGTSKSNGLSFFLIRFADSDNVFGAVRYVVKDSDASTKDIGRGDFFLTVDGQQLNLNNYIDLLFGENDTYTLGMANLDSQTNILSLNGETVTLTKEENLLEDPILTANTLDIDGKKVGYLMYNSFNDTFDEELNDVFAGFKAEGVNELVLDLRYNGGGSVNTSRLLASMIYGTNTDEVFVRQRYNDKIQEFFSDTRYFAETTVDGSAINTLNLNRVFILTSSRTASASELVINGLAPYIEVVQIGDVTVGKNESSLPLVDDPANDYVYDPDREDLLNETHAYGTLLLIGRSENADGFSDYTDGLVPDVNLLEDVRNLGVLGDPQEPLLSAALQLIAPAAAKSAPSAAAWPVEAVATDSDFYSIDLSFERLRDLLPTAQE